MLVLAQGRPDGSMVSVGELMAQVALAKAILPGSVSKNLLTRAQTTFAAEYEDTLILLIGAPKGGDVLAGLEQTLEQTNGTFLPARQLSYETAAYDTASLRSMLAVAARTDEDRVQIVVRALSAGQHYALALRKRTGADQILPDRISVGRAANKDIVLRDESVSKLHAWFELHDGREFSLTDAGSTNSTRVNDIVLQARRSQAVAVGDVIRFGSVTAVLTDADTLWGAIHQK